MNRSKPMRGDIISYKTSGTKRFGVMLSEDAFLSKHHDMVHGGVLKEEKLSAEERASATIELVGGEACARHAEAVTLQAAVKQAEHQPAMVKDWYAYGPSKSSSLHFALDCHWQKDDAACSDDTVPRNPPTGAGMSSSTNALGASPRKNPFTGAPILAVSAIAVAPVLVGIDVLAGGLVSKALLGMSEESRKSSIYSEDIIRSLKSGLMQERIESYLDLERVFAKKWVVQL